MTYELPDDIESNIFLIDAEGNEINYSAFYNAQREFQKNIATRTVVLILCENSTGAVMGLVSFLMNGQIPLLMESNSDSGLILNLIKFEKLFVLFRLFCNGCRYGRIF